MNFKEFKEKYFGKSVEEIKEGLLKEEDFWKDDIDMAKILIDSDKIVKDILQLDKNIPSIFIFRKKSLILNYIYNNFTKLETIPDVDIFDDYDFFVEKAIYITNKNAAMFKELVENEINEIKTFTLETLYSIFKDGIPTIENLEEIKVSLKNMFAEESPEKLKIIENILAFNDPSMKQLREIITSKTDDITTQINSSISNKI